MGKKRHKLQIIYDILEAIHDRNNKILHTHILYKANLSYPVLQDYLQELIVKQLVEERLLHKKKIYSLTDKGFEFLSKYNIVTNFTNMFGLGNAEETT
jgi:predicted transcriptional regulator